jgi:hypothetical protein
MRGLLLLLLGAAGCNQVLGLSTTYGIDGRPDAVGCAGAQFQGPFELPDLSPGADQFDPNERADGLELWFTIQGPLVLKVYVVTRPSVDVDYRQADVLPASFNDANAVRDTDPSIGADGLRVMFLSMRGNLGTRAWEAVRPSLDAPFAAPSEVRGLESTAIDGLDMSLDGKTVYFTNDQDGGRLYRAHRSELTDPFVIETADPDGKPFAMGAAFPSISPDEKELFFESSTNGGILRKTRGDITRAFSDASESINGSQAGDPDLTQDGRTLYVALSSTFWKFTRECP